MKKPIVRILSLLIVVMLIFGLFSSALIILANAAGYVNFVNNSMNFVKTGTNKYTITFNFTDANVTADVSNLTITPTTNTDVNFNDATTEIKQNSTTKSLFHVTLRNVTIPNSSLFLLSFNFTAQYTISAPNDGGGLGTAIGSLSSDSGSGSNSADDQYIAQIITADTTVSKTLTTGRVSTGLKITFNFLDPGIDFLEGDYSSSEFTMPLESSFGWSHNTKLTITKDNRGDYYKATLTNISYNGGSSQNLILTLTGENFAINVPIPNKYFNKSSSETDEIPTSDIVVQSTIARNAQGQKLGVVNEKSGRFTVEVLFYDIGLKNESNSAIDAAKKYAFITTPTGFKLHNGSSGTVERVTSSAEYPRFKATFEGVESTGSVNTLNFRVQYDFAEYTQGIKGEAVATLFQISSESEDESEAAPLKPNIIVQEYNYGEGDIIAGSEFNLDMVFTNTSRTVAVENVVMKITPASGFYIAAASNTVYFPSMGAGESKPYSVALRAMPSRNTGVAGETPTDYSVTVEFAYQYPINKKGDYGDHSTSVKIAIPVEQLDRFAVDEITDYTQYIPVGYEGYVTVPITNKGKSATMNISGTVESKSGAEFTAPPVHYGNLEAGKSSTLNINITINTPGEFTGEAVISYEDENMNQKEIRQPFAIMVEAPMTPPAEMPEMPGMMPEEEKLSPYSIALIVIGGLMLASPAALILIKRVKARGNEDIDEDF